jgi:hypothetical protein
MTEKLIDTMLPVVASAIQAQAANVAQQQRAPAPQPKAPQQQVRAPQPQTQAKPAQLPPPVTHKPRPKVSAQAAAPLKNVTPPTTTKPSNGFPSAVATQDVKQAPETLMPVEDEQKFIQYMNFAAITLTECYTGQKPIPDTASALIESLKPQRIGIADFLRTCPISKVAETMKAYGADETVLHFVEEVYAYIEASAALGTGGEGFTPN